MSGDYASTLRMYESEAALYVEDLNIDNELNYQYYYRELFGNERPGESAAVSSDCFDVVESDMPSMVRTFLGGGDIIAFQPKRKKLPEAIQEAQIRTNYVNSLILGGEDSFKTIFDWLKAALISNFSVVTYYPEEEEKIETIRKVNIGDLELEQLLNTFEDDDEVVKVETEVDEDTSDVVIKVKRKTMTYKLEWIPEEQFLFCPAASIEESTLVGHRANITKGDLIAQFPKKKKEIKDLTGHQIVTNNNINDTKERQISNGDNEINVTPEWYSEVVELKTLCVRIDKDNDGYAERRRILKVGELILEDEPFDNVNYAMLSCYPIPGKAVGKSRVAVTRETQRQKSFLQRGIFNNMANVNKPMTAVNTQKGAVNVDDLLNRRVNGVCRVNGNPAEHIMEMPSPYIGSQALEVIQYVDFTRAQSTGALMASQGLDKDNIYEETATRFNGIKEEGGAKTEMLMRIFAETGFKKLYQGFSWMVENYQNDLAEVEIMGEQITFDPSSWKYEHICKPRVGLALADTEALKANLGFILTTQRELKMGGSTLADESTIYNTLSKMLDSMGVHDVDQYFNNPQIEGATAQAQLEQAQVLIAQLQERVQSNPLAEAEQVKAQARLMEAEQRQTGDREKYALDMMEHRDNLQFKYAQLDQKAAKDRGDFSIKVTELEQDSGENLKGGLDEQ